MYPNLSYNVFLQETMMVDYWKTTAEDIDRYNTIGRAERKKIVVTTWVEMLDADKKGEDDKSKLVEPEGTD